jgi:serine protease Do
MKVSNWGALAGALVLAGAIAPATAHGQSREPIARLVDVFGRGGRIGVTVRDVGGDDAQVKAGVVITDVDPGSPAEQSGMKTGDAVTEFDGERVRSARQFTRLVQETPEGRRVQAVLSRVGQRVLVNVTPERNTFGGDFGTRFLEASPAPPAPPASPAAPRAPRPPAFLSPALPFEPPLMRLTGRRLGVTIESLDSQLADYFGVKEGVLVKSVVDGSPAQKAGIKAGDVMTGINGTRIYDVSDVNRAMDRLDPNGEFTVDVVRDRKTLTLKGKLETRDTRLRSRTRTIV